MRSIFTLAAALVRCFRARLLPRIGKLAPTVIKCRSGPSIALKDAGGLMKTMRAECEGYNRQFGLINRCGASLHNGQTYLVLRISSNDFELDATSGCENEFEKCARVARTGFGTSISRRKDRSEEHTSELQSLAYLVCRLLLEKKKNEKRDT